MFLHDISKAVDHLARALILLLCLPLLGGCVQTLSQTYLDPSDPCYGARQPIAAAGDTLEAQQRAIADQYAAARMQGRERPVVRQNGNRIDFNFANLVSNVVERSQFQQQAYMALKANEHGQNAAAQLSAISGDAQTDYYRLQRVAATIKQLRECRRTQAFLTQASFRGGTVSEPEAIQRLDKQYAAAAKDDELVQRVFQQYGERASVYTVSAQSLGVQTTALQTAAPQAVARRTDRSRPPARTRTSPAPSDTPVAALAQQQAELQAVDRKDSTAVRDAIDAVRVGLQQRSERVPLTISPLIARA